MIGNELLLQVLPASVTVGDTMNQKNRYPTRGRLWRMWPDAELPMPRTARYDWELTDDGWLLPQPSGEDAEPPIELHLREMREVDSRSPEQLRDLCGVVGAVVHTSHPYRGVVSSDLGLHLWLGAAQLFADNIGDQLGLPVADWERRKLLSLSTEEPVVHVREVAARVETVRVLVDHAELALAGERTAEVWRRLGVFNDDALTEHDDHLSRARGVRPRSEERDPERLAWAEFRETLNYGLTEFSPRLIAAIESEPQTDDVTTAFAAACAMVFNDLRDGIPYKRCKDETCGRLFRRQIGRSENKNKPRSSGVEFCTWAHARNQWRRDKRHEADR